jgi:hypothetical protein
MLRVPVIHLLVFFCSSLILFVAAALAIIIPAEYLLMFHFYPEKFLRVLVFVMITVKANSNY